MPVVNIELIIQTGTPWSNKPVLNSILRWKSLLCHVPALKQSGDKRLYLRDTLGWSHTHTHTPLGTVPADFGTISTLFLFGTVE